MINDTLFMMLGVGVILSFAVLGLFIWGAKSGQFDDSEKMMGGLLFDSTEDLNDAVKKEDKKKEASNKKKEKKSEPQE
ncbi:cbb3-type cytochrome oxidase assembly protein CcoS [Halarcobacter anaerophilus]|jgi:cbb3-type cytochrome oxidase maturation protein|uniref:Cbb3-type cytochrome oxidase assembly protein CcoS n=1 Tax=Halarcobacter anaerophilus TaxID=877500 RepID=A0A4Q0XVE0_9BACT|nr:cbb3-type cytochrome oxidase assembly protein CcoS [Halarcobacter anaerophilus]QDF28226.1 cytochrome oxidase maturation protein, cbb3-type [Halarcobacter anaerophilus]RXJ61382.1 cbb3-type cytochrome oxidase assembly protein CcoS [Halarcobacter anaerophilus]